jgi:hypothetical protein
MLELPLVLAGSSCRAAAGCFIKSKSHFLQKFGEVGSSIIVNELMAVDLLLVQ